MTNRRSIKLGNLLLHFFDSIDAELEHLHELLLLRDEQALATMLSLCICTLSC
jgi:hypothetical protein